MTRPADAGIGRRAMRTGLGDICRPSFCIKVIVSLRPFTRKPSRYFPKFRRRCFPTSHTYSGRSRVRVFPELPNLMPDAFCTYRPGDGEWSWRIGDLVLFLDFVAIYLAKHAVWVRTSTPTGIFDWTRASHAPARSRSAAQTRSVTVRVGAAIGIVIVTSPWTRPGRQANALHERRPNDEDSRGTTT